MVNFENNRKLLYNEIPKDYKKLKNVVLSLEQFVAIWFKDENIFSEGKINLFKYLNDNIDNIFTKKSDSRLALKSKRSFYRTFACDLEWAKKYNFCEELLPSESVNLQDYDGAYKIDGVKYFDTANINYYEEKPNSLEIKFYENVDNTLDLNGVEKTIWDNIQKYSGIELKWNDTNKKFEMYLGDSKINGDFVFNSDKNGFKFSINLGLKKLEGTGIRKSSSTPTQDTTVNKKKDTTTPVEKKKDEIPVVRTNTLRFNNEKKTYVATKNCDNFPFTLGCSNKLIGDLNASIFNGDRMNDVYSDELQNTLDNGGNFWKNPNMEITKDLWTKLMNRKIIKETVKKVLKERILKK